MLLEMADRLQDSAWIISLTSTGWTAALIAILHYYSMFVLVGSMAIVDLGVLGIIGPGPKAPSMAKRIFPWVWTALAVNLVSGFIMFAGDATAYVPAWTFRLKVLVVLLAILFNILLLRNLSTWEDSLTVPRAAKILAIISLIFWVGAIVMGVEVPAISRIG